MTTATATVISRKLTNTLTDADWGDTPTLLTLTDRWEDTKDGRTALRAWLALWVDRDSIRCPGEPALRQHEDGRWCIPDVVAILNGEEDPPTFTGVWINPDGTLWHDRDRSNREDKMTWPRLLYRRVEVTSETEKTAVPGKVRAKEVWVYLDAKRPGWRPRRVKVWVHRSDDNRAIVNADPYADADELTRRKRVFYSPSHAAERLGVDITMLYYMRRDGITVPGPNGEPKKIKPRKNDIWRTTRLGDLGGIEADYWAKDFVEMVRDRRNSIPHIDTLPAYQMAFTVIGSPKQRSKLRAKGLLESAVRLAMNPDGIPSRYKVPTVEQVADYNQSRLVDPLPAQGKVSLKEAARILKRSEATVLEYGEYGYQGARLDVDWGEVLCLAKKNNPSQLREGHRVTTASLRRVHELMYPGLAFPLDHLMHAGSVKVNGNHPAKEMRGAERNVAASANGAKVESEPEPYMQEIKEIKRVMQRVDEKTDLIEKIDEKANRIVDAVQATGSGMTRDEWIVAQREAGEALKAIALGITAHPEWDQFSDDINVAVRSVAAVIKRLKPSLIRSTNVESR